MLKKEEKPHEKLLQNDWFYLGLSLIYLVCLYFLGVESKWYVTAYFIYWIPFGILKGIHFFKNRKKSDKY